jgi:histo-blood group ABO system transferase
MAYLKKIGMTLLLFFSLSSATAGEKEPPKNIGLLIVATGKYIRFVNPLIESAKKHFCQNHHVTYFVFTDQEFDPPEDVVRIEQPRLGWPYDTMMRYQVYLDHWPRLLKQDYLFACDADMLFVGDVGDQTLYPKPILARKKEAVTSQVASMEGKGTLFFIFFRRTSTIFKTT